MTTLAPNLPHLHPFAGGYPRLGGQALPTDPDAIDYLARVAAADGAAVEVGVAMAVDAFVKGCKADSAGYAGDPTRTVWDSLQACCIMAGARTISGALVPLKGTAPTAQGGWTSNEYSRGGSAPGLKGNGSTLYLDTNRANNADPQNDAHQSAYISAANTLSVGVYVGSGVADTGASNIGSNTSSGELFTRSRHATAYGLAGLASATGFAGHSRSSSGSYTSRAGNGNYSIPVASDGLYASTAYVFARNSAGTPSAPTDARLAFYSIGSACDLAAMDARVSTLMAAIQAFLP